MLHQQQHEPLQQPTYPAREDTRKTSDTSTSCDSVHASTPVSASPPMTPKKISAEQSTHSPMEEQKKTCPKLELRGRQMEPAPGENGEASPSSPRKRMRPEDFNLIQLLGVGAYSRVALVEQVATKRRYAMKVMEKKFLAQVEGYDNGSSKKKSSRQNRRRRSGASCRTHCW